MIQQSCSRYILKRIEIRISKRLFTPLFIEALSTIAKVCLYFLVAALYLHLLPVSSLFLPCFVGEPFLGDSESYDLGLCDKFTTNCEL